MGDISLAPAEQPAAVRDSVGVVFATTDPERDTPGSLGKWLKSFGPRLEQGKQFARRSAILVEDPKKRHDGIVTSSRGAQVAAFSPADGKADVIYTVGTSGDDYANGPSSPAQNAR